MGRIFLFGFFIIFGFKTHRLQMAFADDKVCALAKINAFNCPIGTYISSILTDYDKVLASYLALHEYFDCYSSFAGNFLSCFDLASLNANGIYYNQTSTTLTDALLVYGGTATEVNITIPPEGYIPECVVAGGAVVNTLSVTGTGFILVFSVQGGAQIKVLSTDATSYIQLLRIVGCNGMAATVNSVSAGSRIVNTDVGPGAFYGGVNCIDPTDVCADDVTALNFTNIGPNSLVLKWTAALSSIRTIVYFRQNNAPYWREPNTLGEKVKGNYIEDGPGYVFRELDQSTYYDFKVVNVCSNGVLSAGTIATQQTAGDATSGGGGGGDLLWIGKLQFLATDGQTEYTPADIPNPLIGANGVDVSVEGTIKFQDVLGDPTDDRNFQLDNTLGKIIFNSGLGAGQQVIINIYR